MDTVDVVDSVVVKPLLRGWSHVLAFTVVAVLGTLMASVAGASLSERLWLVVYVAGTLTMFGVSSLYHCLRWQDRGRAIMRRLDHSAIFLAIAGAYTPIMAVASMAGRSCGVVCGVGRRHRRHDAGVVACQSSAPLFTAVRHRRLVCLSPSRSCTNLGGVGFALVLGGGLLYTLGAVVYAPSGPTRGRGCSAFTRSSTSSPSPAPAAIWPRSPSRRAP